MHDDKSESVNPFDESQNPLERESSGQDEDLMPDETDEDMPLPEEDEELGTTKETLDEDEESDRMP